MEFAFSLLIYFLILQFIANNGREFIDKVLGYYVIFVSFVILNLFRIYAQQIFPDIPNYEHIFASTSALKFDLKSGFSLNQYSSSVEIGFSIFISIFKIFSENFSIFLFFICLIELAVFYCFCKKYRIDLVNAFPIYIALTYVTFQIGILRQALACCLFLIGLIYINKKFIFILLGLLAFTFHRSAACWLLLFWVDRVFNRKILYIIIVSAVLVYLVKFDLYQFISSYSFYLEDILIGDRIAYYLYERENAYLGIGFWDRIFLLIMMNLAYRDLQLKNKINSRNNIIYNLGTVVLVLQMVLFSSPSLTSRLRFYFSIFPVIFLSEYINLELRNRLRSLFRFILVLYLMFHVYLKGTYLL